MKKLGFGFMRLPLTDANDASTVDLEQVIKMTDLFMQRGFTYFDSAYVYHKKQSEHIIRKALVERYPRDSYQLCTKLPMAILTGPEDNDRIFNEQLEYCGVDYFDVYLMHAMNGERFEKAKKFGCYEYMQQKRAEGKAKKIGFSFHGQPDLLEEMIQTWPDVDIIQLQINYIDWENPSVQAKKCYEIATKYNKPVIVMEPVKGGTLVNLPPEAVEVMKQRRPDLSVPSWAIRFSASLDNVMVVLSGMSNYEQVDDNTSYMENFRPYTEEDYKALDKVLDIFNQAAVIPCTACGYCVDGCPMGIPIPKYFGLYNNDQLAFTKNKSNNETYYRNMTDIMPKASRCIGCGKCEKACPQNVKVIEGLVKVAERFEKKK
ncbi:MAG: aldo/keto reductase [Oscillospiraceae bacterium]|nr:aldo/keto reductase [Oscillospiraceae bacterium]